MKSLILSATCVTLMTASVTGQGVFDDFKGTVVDQTKWYVFGAGQHLKISNSKLSFSLPSDTTFGLVSMDAIRGDFDLILDFAKFAAVSQTSQAEFFLTVIGAEVPFHQMEHLDIGIEGNSTTRQFFCEGEKASVGQGSAQYTTKASAGELRLQRTQQNLTAMFRESGQTAWHTLRVYNNFMKSNLVYVVIQPWADRAATVSAECDKLSYVGPLQMKTSPTNYGKGCNSMISRAWSFPYLGNANYGIITDVDSRLIGAPLLLLVGFTQLSIDLISIGAPGCSLLTSPDLVLVTPPVNSESEGIGYIPIPNNVGLVGVGFNSQFLALAPRWNALGLIFANAVQTKITKL